MIRFGTIAEVDVSAARCRVTTGAITSDWIPWLVPRVGTTIEWSAPSVSEQGLVLCPDGDTTGAVFLRGLYSDLLPAPVDDAHRHLVRFADGTEIRYDDAAHALDATLIDGGTATITASGGITVNGDVQVNGKLTASDDVLAGSISLKGHTHGGVQSGGSSTGAPQ